MPQRSRNWPDRFALHAAGAAWIALGLLMGFAPARGDETAAPASELRTGPAAFGDWHADAPGVRRRITAADLPKPFATPPVANPASPAQPPPDAIPKAPPGFKVERFASGLDGPRLIRVAPDGTVFIAETAAGRILAMRTRDGAAQPIESGVFAQRLDGPFGLALYPPGAAPTWLYVATNNSVVRFPYKAGALVAGGRPDTVVSALAGTTFGHSTRDIQFSPDGKTMFVSVGSGSNVGEDMPLWSRHKAELWTAVHGLGATWDDETDRADVLAFDPDGGHRRVFATGLRNCVGLATNPKTSDLWCATNERDGLGDDLVPDFVTRVREDAFYGWPWFYIGSHEDPRRVDERRDLVGKISVPDVLIQPHSAPLEMTFYDAPAEASARFPKAWADGAYVALHGSWNRAKRTGYKVVRVETHDGVPTGVYADFLTGFVLDDATVWGRPVGVAVAHDGALLVGEDANGTIWRVAPTAP